MRLTLFTPPYRTVYVSFCVWQGCAAPAMMRRLAQKATLASNLRAARERAGISQETLAQRADMHRNAVALIEAGKRDPRVSTVAKLAKALGVATEELLKDL